MYGKETLELEDARVVLINNEIMKKTDTMEEASGLVIKKGRGRSRSRGPKRDKEFSNLGVCYYCKKPGHFKRDCLKRDEALKKAGKRSDGASTSVKSEQAGVVEEDLCAVLTAQSGQGQLSDIRLLNSGATYHMRPRREWFSTYQPYDGGSVLMGNDAKCNVVR